MTARKIDLLYIAGVVAGASYFFGRDLALPAAALAAWKGAGVGLFALWALAQARTIDGWLIAIVLGFGALGDVLIEGNLIHGAFAFLAGHLVAIVLYVSNRRAAPWRILPVALILPAIAFFLPDARGEAPGIALYALGLGAMVGSAWISRFLWAFVGLGALCFALSDLVLFAKMGPLGGSILPSLLVWPLYLGGQALIAWGVVDTLRRERAGSAA